MIRFILTMLFYGAFLAVIAIACMWFFLGMTIQQSINWISQKTSQVVSVSQSTDTATHLAHTPGQAADAQLNRISNMVK